MIKRTLNVNFKSSKSLGYGTQNMYTVKACVGRVFSARHVHMHF